MNYTAIVIAAGLSTRMGEFKPLLDIGGKPALFRLLDTIRSAGIESVVVVTGCERDAIEKALLIYDVPGIDIEHNADYESGMFSSVKTGIRFAVNARESAAALLFPVDVPLVSAQTILGLIDAYHQEPSPRLAPCYAVPVYKDKNGHPLLIPREFFDEVLNYTGEGGLKGVRSKRDAEMLRYYVNDIGCVLDMDTPEDYQQILAFDESKDDG